MPVGIMKLPEGVSLTAEEWASVWPVGVKQVDGHGFTVCYLDGKGTIHPSSEITVEYEPGRQHEAKKMEQLLHINGWRNTRLEALQVTADPFIDFGGEG